MVVTFAESDGGTDVTIVCEHIPAGIRPEDNEAGCRSSLEKLACSLRRSAAVLVGTETRQ